ncbi:hypothetical protein MKZ38_008844 [Zalerion maritima]|uniref:Dimethylaniline monooxygenase n=1 Tax=Zalerion maritima TaxID=339359 RepID=A0AAD5RVZ7_9PEZI|nr:hypothetical protein MKZ38_008844 [Zalerion maritima]
MRVAVIGGGPSGLVTLKYLTAAHQYFPIIKPIEAMLFEATSSVGGVFFHHSYEDGEMVSSKYLTTFSDFRPKKDDPDYYTSEQYVKYLSDYASRFDLWPHIKLSTRVEAVRRQDGGGHVVVYKGEDGQEVEYECDAIAVCSGLHDKPSYPQVEGIENVPEVWHSENFKDRSQLENKTVMVLGSGETAADICYLGMTTPSVKQVVLCHRNGWMGAPKQMPKTILFPGLRGYKDEDFEGMDPFDEKPNPIDVSQSTLFDTMYVHPMVRDSMLVWDHYKLIALDGSWLVAGNGLGYDQWVGALPDERRHPSKMFFNKAWNRIQPFLVPPYRPSDSEIPWAEKIRRKLVGTPWCDGGRYLDLAPFPTHFSSDGAAHFKDNGRIEYQKLKSQVIKPDLVIYATGYRQTFPFFEEHNSSASETGKKPYPHANKADVRNLWKRGDPSVGFIGFVRPGFGAIPALSELQAMLWTMSILGRIDPESLKEDDEYHYRILTPPGSRVRYGVEHEAYSWQLASDMGVAPGITDVLKLGWNGPKRSWYRLPYIWAGGNHFNAKFRMVGPWKWDGAVGVMTGELWETIMRRGGLFGNFTLVVLPLSGLGTASLLAWLWCTFWAVLAFFHLAKPVEHVNHLKNIWMENLKIEEEMKMKGMDRMMVTNGNGNGKPIGSMNRMENENRNTSPLKENGHGNRNGYGTT